MSGTGRGLVGNLVVFGLAILASVGFYSALAHYADAESLLVRYTAGHWVEYIETGMFFWGMLALAGKAWQIRKQRRALRVQVLPIWNGQPAPVSEAGTLLERLGTLPRGLRGSALVERLRGGLDFVKSRGSTDGLDDHLRAQSDADANAADGSYALIRYITWAIPILGFLGTVLGITDAIANVTPEQLATSISGVTAGLAIAFDTTAIALGYSMALMFFTFLLDRREQAVLAGIDEVVERELAHRFERVGGEANEVVDFVRRNNELQVRASELLVKKQAELWAQTMDEMRSRIEAAGKASQDRLTTTLGKLLDQTLAAHQQRLAGQEKQVAEGTARLLERFEKVGQALRETAAIVDRQSQRMAEQTALLGKLLESEQTVLRLQETMGQNLQALAHAGGFQQALHSLTAAIHLLTARSESPAAYAGGTLMVGNRSRQGNAA
jgi:hypothetical protein